MSEENNGYGPGSFKVNWKIKESAKGNLHYEYTVRGETIEEVRKLSEESKKELDTLCKKHNREI